MKIYRLSDRVSVKIGELVFKLAPLSFTQKAEILDCKKIVAGEEILDRIGATKLAIKYSLKDVEGLEDIDGNKYELDKDDSGNLSDSCIDELLNVEVAPSLITTCFNFLNGVPSHIVDPETGKKLKGVEIIKKEGKQ